MPSYNLIIILENNYIGTSHLATVSENVPFRGQSSEHDNENEISIQKDNRAYIFQDK